MIGLTDRQLFDKVTVLYEGKQIFFGHTDQAKDYFTNLGFDCPDRMPTPDFLTAMTSPSERFRLIRPGFERPVPQTSEDFAAAWKTSPHRQRLSQEIEDFERDHPIGDQAQADFAASRKAQQAKGQ